MAVLCAQQSHKVIQISTEIRHNTEIEVEIESDIEIENKHNEVETVPVSKDIQNSIKISNGINN